MKFLILGANGQLGSELRAIAPHYAAHDFVFISRNELDFSKVWEDDFALLLSKHQPDLCINAAAYTAVDKAESEDFEFLAAINHHAPVKIASRCKQSSVQFIHISSDYVYHAHHINRPLLETDPTAPQSAYARTKQAAEAEILSVLPTAVIVRTSWVFSSFGNNFVKTMLKLGREKQSLNVVCDQIGTPTYARDLATSLLAIASQICENKARNLGGIYNYSNEGVTSWYDFAKTIHRFAAINTCDVQPIPTSSYPTPAARPPFSVLDKTKIKAVFGIKIRDWQDALHECMQLIDC